MGVGLSPGAAVSGTWAYAAGASGTVTLPAGATVLEIYAESHDPAGAVSIFGGSNMPLNGSTGGGNHINVTLDFQHGRCRAVGVNRDIVFTLTTSYFVQYVT